VDKRSGDRGELTEERKYDADSVHDNRAPKIEHDDAITAFADREDFNQARQVACHQRRVADAEQAETPVLPWHFELGTPNGDAPSPSLSLDVPGRPAAIAVCLSLRRDHRLQFFHDIVEVLELASVDSFMDFRGETNQVTHTAIFRCGAAGVSLTLLQQGPKVCGI
jgi:hypothetical protein